jgi:NAD-specific glutamate dehydrogenase
VAESLDVLTLAERADTPIIDALTVWQQVGGRFAVEKLIQLARGLPQTDPATREAVTGLVEDLAAHRRAITAAALAAGSVEVWIAGRAERVQTADQTIGEVTGGPAPFFARLALAERAVRGLAQT